MRFFRRRRRSGPLLQDATTNFRVLGDVPEQDLFGLRLEELPPSELHAAGYSAGNFRIESTAASTFAAASGSGNALTGVGRAVKDADLAAAAAGAVNGDIEARWGTALPIVNGNFETGDTTGWTAFTDTGLSILAGGPAGSTFFVAAGQNPFDASGQYIDFPIDVLPYTDSGNAELKLDWQGSSFTDADLATILVEYFDGTGGSGNLIGAHASPRTDQGSGTWAPYSTSSWVPPGARSCRLQLRGIRVAGTEDSAYYDEIVGTFLLRAHPHIQIEMLQGDELTGWTATVGSTGLLTANTVGVWHNHATGLAGWPVLFHSTTNFTGYRDSAVPASQLDGVDDGLATCELTAQLIGAGTADSVRVWVEALDNVGASLGVVCQSGASAVTTSTSSTPVRALGAIPVGTRTLRYWQQMVRASGTTDTAASRIGIMIEAPITAAVAEAALDASASGAVVSVGHAIVQGDLTAAAAGTFTPQLKPKSTFLVGTLQNGSTMGVGGTDNGSRFSGFNNGEVGAGYPEEGDTILVFMAVGSDLVDAGLGIIDVETGESYTALGPELTLDLGTTDADLHLQAFYYRKHTSSVNNSWPTFLSDAIGDRYYYRLQCWRGLDPIEPFGTPVTATGTATSRATPPAITPTRSGSTVAVAGCGYLGNSTSYSSTGLLGIEQGYDVVDSPPIRVLAGWFDWVDGTYTPNAWLGGAGTNAAYGWAAMSVEVLPESPGNATFEASATGALSAVSEYDAASSFSANGLSSAAFAGGSIRAAVLSSTGIGTVLAVAEEPAVGSDFAAAAVAEFLAAGTALVAAALEGTGVGAAAAEGAAINATALNAPSLTTAAFEGALTQGAVMAASGTAGGTFESSVIAAAQGSLTAAGALSSVATAVTQAVLDSSSAGQLDGAASAVTQAVLAGGGVGALDGAASAITQIVMSAAASGTLDGAGGATVDTVLSSTAQGSALWGGGASSDAALLATGTGALLARGGYGGTTNAGERRIELAAVSRVITLGAASDRVIYADTQDRTIYVAAEGRVTQ